MSDYKRIDSIQMSSESEFPVPYWDTICIYKL
nr:MAG TPA: hypothetical protein [Caudoviricetes sp.]